METGIITAEMGAEVRRDALAELRNHADAAQAAAHTKSEADRADEISALADDVARIEAQGR